MELRLNIELNQIIGIIRDMPLHEKMIIKNQLEKDLNTLTQQKEKSLKQILLSGPVMTEEGYAGYQDFKNQFNAWTKNLSA